MRTSSLRAVRHGGNLNGYGLGTITVDETTGQVSFTAASDMASILKSMPWALIIGAGAVGYFIYTKLTRGRY